MEGDEGVRRIGLYTILGLLIGFPSLQILEVTTLSSSPAWPNRLRPGQLLMVKRSPSIKYSLNGRHFSAHPSRDVNFAVVPIADHVELYAWEAPHQTQFFVHPIWPIHRSVVDVDLPPSAGATSLRLPASVRKRLDMAEEKQKQADRDRLTQLLSSSTFSLSASCWRLPLGSKKTSQFASPRTLPSGRTYYHTGEDRRAYPGTPIAAVGPGKVVYVGKMVVPGKSVIIDHGASVFSRYLHLSEFKVEEGAIVAAGDVIGLSGATGRIEAPHLHWEILWQKTHAHPSEFVSEWNKLCLRTQEPSAS